MCKAFPLIRQYLFELSHQRALLEALTQHGVLRVRKTWATQSPMGYRYQEPTNRAV